MIAVSHSKVTVLYSTQNLFRQGSASMDIYKRKNTSIKAIPHDHINAKRNIHGMRRFSIWKFFHTVKPLKTVTPWGMKNWPSYRGGRLMEVILLRTLRVILHLGNEKVLKKLVLKKFSPKKILKASCETNLSYSETS